MTSEFGVAVHALVFLSHKARQLSSEALAENVCTNPARIRKIMSKLKKAGLVATKEGAEGGYHAVRSAAEVSLREIGDALGVKYVEASWRSGNAGMECMIASGMADVMDQVYADLDEECKRRLETITLAEIERQLINRKRLLPT